MWFTLKNVTMNMNIGVEKRAILTWSLSCQWQMNLALLLQAITSFLNIVSNLCLVVVTIKSKWDKIAFLLQIEIGWKRGIGDFLPFFMSLSFSPLIATIWQIKLLYVQMLFKYLSLKNVFETDRYTFFIVQKRILRPV